MSFCRLVIATLNCRIDLATGQHLTRLAPASSDEIRKLLVKSPSKSYELDPMPTYLLKQCVDNVLPVITAMVNTSMNEMSVPTAFKQAIVRPLLKKPGLDMNFKNYRPISNLPFVSEIIQKVVASRIEDYLDKHKVHDNRQSSYRSFHSTDTAFLRVHHDIATATVTALFRVHHDIATALDNNSRSIFVMLDLSAAFDVIDHGILYQRLEYTFEISGSALAWIKSYLSNRSQQIAIGFPSIHNWCTPRFSARTETLLHIFETSW